MYSALIIDTLSIQSYIFGSNKLKENIGGSFIIEKLVYKQMIPEALKQAGLANDINLCHWEKNPDEYRLEKHPDERVEIGYIGGGNALLIFRQRTDADAFVKIYSQLLLTHFPGIKPAFGFFDGFDYQEGEETYKKYRKELHRNLIHNRNFSTVQVLPFKHGIVEDCPWTNEAQEVRYKEGDTVREISQSAWSRLSYVKEAQDALKEGFSQQIGEFTFTDELEKFGQPDDKGYIAIVHADGNGVGQRFINCRSLAETRKLSAAVALYADKVMKQLIGYIANDLFGTEGTLKASGEWELDQDKESKKEILPIRPLIIGGDDITFVCEGRLGIHLAEKLLEFMTKTPVDENKITACAGVAIVHTKYPFYKAYQLAEELIKRAKKESRNHNDGESSWLDYMISTGGFSGSLEDIIKDQFALPDDRKLKNGPYRVDGDTATIKDLRKGMKHFLKGTESNGQWPRNKIKDLRDALRKDDAIQSYFLAELEARGLELPNGGSKLWDGEKTPYYDMIELLDFYPENLLK